MEGRVRFLFGGVVIFFAALVSSAVDPVVIKGSHFFYKTNGSEFFIRGITYQPQRESSMPTDPLGVSLSCMRDITYLSQLTTNVIRVSEINSTLDHSACMTALASIGIYVLVDLPGSVEINRTNPQWNLDIYGAWIQTIDAMAGYSNVLGFFAGNSIVTSTNSPTAAYVKAAVRDLKAYIASKNFRAIPVGYQISASDNYDVISTYMVCQNRSEAVDFLGISDSQYSGCADSNFINSGYQEITEQYTTFPVPIFFADYGCKDVLNTPRLFNEVAYIYGPQMTNVISGGIVNEYFQDSVGQGFVSISGSTVTPLAEFTSYSSQIAKITPASTYASDYVVTNTITQSCPTVAFSASPTLPPAVDEGICSCMMRYIQCKAKPGLDPGTAALALDTICGTSAERCPALHGNGSTGVYGAFSMCNVTERLSWALQIHYLGNTTGCGADVNASWGAADFPAECDAVMAQAGQSGTGTITSLPSSTMSIPSHTGTVMTTPIPKPGNSGNQWAPGPRERAGIVIGAIIVLASLSLGIFWCWRRRKHMNSQKGIAMEDNGQDLRNSDRLDLSSGLRGGSVSFISDDSRDMSELPPFDGSYMGQSWSRSELQSSRSGFQESTTGTDMAISEGQSPATQHSDLEIVSSNIPPSPMGSDKELPAFRTRLEDKSLASMKLLSPVIKVSPV